MSWTLTEAKYNRLLTRLKALESHANDLAVAIDQFITLGEVQELLVIAQQDNAALQNRVDSLEDRLTQVEEEPLS